jgi:hypothetical protein
MKLKGVPSRNWDKKERLKGDATSARKIVVTSSRKGENRERRGDNKMKGSRQGRKEGKQFKPVRIGYRQEINAYKDIAEDFDVNVSACGRYLL